MIDKSKLIDNIKRETNSSLISRIVRRIRNNNKLTKIKQLIRDKKSEHSVTKLFTGDPFHIILPDNISKTTYLTGVFESDDSIAFVNLINQGCTFVDIGAHIGYYSVIAARLVGRTGKVYAFEPTTSTYEITTKNLSPFDHAQVFNTALFDTKGEIVFNDYGIQYMSLNSHQSARIKDVKLTPKKIKVPTDTLDAIAGRCNMRPDVIKIDAESAELQILKGAHRVLTEYEPVVIIELGDFIEIDPQSSVKIIDHMARYGYKAYEFNGEWKLHTKRDELYPSINIYFSKNPIKVKCAN